MAPAHFCGKEKQILLALLCSSRQRIVLQQCFFWCSSRQRIVLQQCFFSFRSFAASPSVTSTLYFFSMSDLTVDTVKAMPCQALRGEPSQRGLNPKGNLGPGHTCTFLAVPPKRNLRFRRCLGNGGGVSYALAESLDFATPKKCERSLRFRGSALAEPAW